MLSLTKCVLAKDVHCSLGSLLSLSCTHCSVAPLCFYVTSPWTLTMLRNVLISSVFSGIS
ncbi:hypothetical protein INR49_010800 [Caranx melampygus]|nr:hypothetical protein INR49_010800 [Caranx melampygus]